MGETVVSYAIQQGSSNTLQVRDQNTWRVVREAWEGARLINVQLVYTCTNEATARLVCDAMNGLPTALDELVHEAKATDGRWLWYAAKYNARLRCYESPMSQREREKTGGEVWQGPIETMGGYGSRLGAIRRAVELFELDGP